MGRECDASCRGFTTYGGAPSEITVAILDADGREIVRQTFFPDYRDTDPAGGGCGPVCRAADIELTIPESAAVRGSLDAAWNPDGRPVGIR